MDRFPSDSVMQAVAAENNLAETAFFVPEGDDYRLRWFTPTVEVPLCGHATLASAAVVMERLEPGRTSVLFHSASGPLTVTRKIGAAMSWTFRSRTFERIAAPAGMAEALGAHCGGGLCQLIQLHGVLDDVTGRAVARTRHGGDRELRSQRCDRDGAGEGDYDFVSRYFAPAKGIPEDPVTGSAHCMLAPYWAERLGKTSFQAFQASRRGGEVGCRLHGDRVELEGACVFYLEGMAEI